MLGGFKVDYDVLIIGGGIIGCAAAYELSKYSLNIALIERDSDIANDSVIPNTSIIYDIAIGYGEIAYDNGVNFKLEEEVIGINQTANGFKVVTSRNKFTCKVVVNTTPEKNFSNDLNIDNTYYIDMNSLRKLIDDSVLDKKYYKTIGKHKGLTTMTPAIARLLRESIVEKTNCKLKKDYNDRRRELFRFRSMNNEERNKLIKIDSKYGKIICPCNLVTEGEIVDAIRRPLGARTIEGVKRRTGACQGDCQGSYCLQKIAHILSRELNKSINLIVKDSKLSKIMPIRIKEFI